MSSNQVDDISIHDILARIPVREVLLAIAIAIFILTRLWWLLACSGVMPIASLTYAGRAQQGVDAQRVVYSDFPFEYPPVAWRLVAAPRLMDSESCPGLLVEKDTFRRYLIRYLGWFHFELMLADVVCWGLMFAIGRRMLGNARSILPIAYSLITIAQPHLIFDTLDLVLLMFLLLFIECWLCSLDDTVRADYWALASYFFLGLGISFKIVPVVFVPFLLLADWRQAAGAGKIVVRVLVLAVAALGPFLVHMPSAGWDVFALFQYHAERGIHLESIWGSIMLVASAFGVPCEPFHSHGSFDLKGDLSALLRIASSVAVPATAALLGLWALLRGARFDRRLALDTAILALINSSVLSHVYSPQYANWLLPLALLLALDVFPPSWLVWCGFATMIIIILAASSWIFPYHYMDGLAELEAAPVSLSVIRSGCLMGLAMMLNWDFFAKYARTNTEHVQAIAV